MENNTPIFNAQGTYTHTLRGDAVLLNLTLHSSVSLKSKDKYVLLVLDISGSMAGAKIETSKKAICELLETLYMHTPNPRVDLIVFDNTTTFYPLEGKTLEEASDKVSRIEAQGGTCFIPVFNLLKKLLSNGHHKEQSLKYQPKKVKQDSLSYPEEENIKYEGKKIEDVAVILLSDGQAEHLSELQPYISELRQLAEENLSSAEFHTLGFGSDHDARLLEEITKTMPTQGTFQYVRESSEIRSCIEAITGLIIEKRLNTNVSWENDSVVDKKRINFVSKKNKMEVENGGGWWEGLVSINKPIKEYELIKHTLKLNIKLGESYVTIPVSTEYKQSDDKVVEIHQNLGYVNEELKKISDAIISENFNKNKAEEYRAKVAEFREVLNELIREVFKLKINERDSVIENAKDLNEYMDKIGELLRSSANRGLSNDLIASVNALAYRQVTKNNNLKTLDKRAIHNVDLLNQVDQKAQEVAQKIDEKSFTEKYNTLIEEVGCCSMNLSNLPEAVKSGDCLCLTFDIGRPEVAIQDASRIIVKKIYPTMICATAFLNCVKHSMRLNPNNSGGFDVLMQGNIVKGASNETITAALPMFFCPEHWEAASQYMKPIIGWDVTLDPLGYDYNQIRTVPFLLLMKAMDEKHENPNEFNTRVVKWLLETCCQIIKDEMAQNPNSNLALDVKAIWEKYAVDGTVRGVDTVQNLNVFLTQVYCLQELGLLKMESKEELMKKIVYSVEEEMRRRQEKAKVWNSIQVRKNLKQIFGKEILTYVNLVTKEGILDKMVEHPIEEKKKDEESLEEKEKRFFNEFEKAQKTQPKKNYLSLQFEREKKNQEKAELNKAKKEEKKLDFKLDVPEEFLNQLRGLDFKIENFFDEDPKKLENNQKDHIIQVYQSFQYAVKQLKIWLKLWNFGLEECKKVENFGLKNVLQLFTLHIQNKIDHKNSERQENFKNKKHVDPFNPEEARNYMFTVGAQLVYNAYMKKLNSKPKEMNRNLDSIRFFAETNNLKAAAGFLVCGLNLGSFEHLQQILRHSDKCDKVLEKLLMIKRREYKGVTFEFDFKMRKKFARQLYKKYEKQYTYGDWKELWYRQKPKATGFE